MSVITPTFRPEGYGLTPKPAGKENLMVNALDWDFKLCVPQFSICKMVIIILPLPHRGIVRIH